MTDLFAVPFWLSPLGFRRSKILRCADGMSRQVLVFNLRGVSVRSCHSTASKPCFWRTSKENPGKKHAFFSLRTPPIRTHSKGTKIQPKEGVFGRISLQTSGQKLRSGPPNAGKTSILGRTSRADVHEKLRSRKLRADFSFPILSGG